MPYGSPFQWNVIGQAQDIKCRTVGYVISPETIGPHLYNIQHISCIVPHITVGIVNGFCLQVPGSPISINGEPQSAQWDPE